MDEKERLLRNEIMEIIDFSVFNSEGDSVAGCVTENLMNRFYIIPKPVEIVEPKKPNCMHMISNKNCIVNPNCIDCEVEKIIIIRTKYKPEPTPRPAPGINTSGPTGGD